MKKLLAAGSCILALQSISNVALSQNEGDNPTGKRTLIKAIAVIVNSESARKVPQKKIYLPNDESPEINSIA